MSSQVTTGRLDAAMTIWRWRQREQRSQPQALLSKASKVQNVLLMRRTYYAV